MMRQWAQIKQAYPDALVLFRLGDFYEAFHEDAVRLAEVCEVTLTSRPVQHGERAPMAGVPYHAADSYIAQLVRRGLKVAIVEQTGAEASLDKRARMSGQPMREEGREDGASEGPSGRAPGAANLMGREVVRVVTPGTLVESELLDARANNYLAAVFVEPKSQVGTRIGLSYADVTTGEFVTTELVGAGAERQLLDELVRLRPAELLVPEVTAPPSRPPSASANPPSANPPSTGPRSTDSGHGLPANVRDALPIVGVTAVIRTFPAWRFDEANARRALLEHFGTLSLAAFGCDEKPAAVRAAGAVLAYIQESQRGGVAQVTSLSTVTLGAYMALDPATRRNLELTHTLRGEFGRGEFGRGDIGRGDGGRAESGRGVARGSLLWVLDQTETAMGGRLMRRWLEQPLLDRSAIEARLEAVAYLVENTTLRQEVRAGLKGLPDLERLLNRIVAGYAGPRELVALARGLRRVPELAARLGAAERDLGLGALPAALVLSCPPDVAAVAELVGQTLADDPPATLGVAGIIRPGHAAELDAVHAGVADAKAWIAGLEARERARTGIRKLKVGFNKVFGYYLEVTRAQADAAGGVPADYLRKQTLVDTERYITPDLKEREAEVLGAEERILALERELYTDLVARVAAVAGTLLTAAREVAQLDVLAGLAAAAVAHGYVRPVLSESWDLKVKGGRHPVVERMRPAEPFVANDLDISAGEIVLLTGPNMAGKSTIGRQMALIVLMAQMGSFVPAQAAEIGIVDRIFTRIGAQDELAAGQSTFMVEMVETANILHHATARSLIILDELGRGTSTYDGMAIAWAVVEYIHGQPGLGARTLFATHYHELTALAEVLDRVRNVSMAVAETPDGGIAFLHRVVAGAADRSYGVHVAELAGMPREVVGRAWAILRRLEAEGNVPLQAQGDLRGAAQIPPAANAAGQLALFAPAPTGAAAAVVEALAALDVENMTPIAALRTLDELCRMASGNRLDSTSSKAPGSIPGSTSGSTTGKTLGKTAGDVLGNTSGHVSASRTGGGS